MKKKSDEFKEWMRSAGALESVLKKSPKLITEQDEDGLTLLHHAAQVGRIRNSTGASEILNVLFNTPGLDFTIKDNAQNTAVHVAALSCKDRVTCQYVFPTLVKEASKRGFDFSMLGQQGQSVLHIATRTSCINFGNRINNVKNVLNNATDPGLDVLSSSGSTAFFYAVNHCYFDEAKTLLVAGADPMLFGSEDRDPFAMIEEHLKVFSETLSQDEDKEIKNLIDQLDELKQEMLSISSVKSKGMLK